MKTWTSKVIALSAGAVGTLMIAGSVSAASETRVFAPQVSPDVPIKYVSYADLNIASEAGRATLLGRIERAAEEVCGSADYRRAGGLSQASHNAQCQEDAIAAAVSQLPTSSVAYSD